MKIISAGRSFEVSADEADTVYFVKKQIQVGFLSVLVCSD